MSRSCRSKGAKVVVPSTIPSSDIATLKKVTVMNFNGDYNLTANLHLLTLAPCAASVDTAVVQTEDLLKLYLLRAKKTVYLIAALSVPTVVDKETHYMLVTHFPEEEESSAVDVMPDAWIEAYFSGLVGKLKKNLSYEIALVMIHAVSSCPTVYTGLKSFEVPVDLEQSLENQIGMGELDQVKGQVKHFGQPPRYYDIATTWAPHERETRPIIGMVFFRDNEVICINVNTACLIIQYAAVNAVVKSKYDPYTLGFAMMNGDLVIFEFCELMREVTFTTLVAYLAERVDVAYEVVDIDSYVYDARNQQYVSKYPRIDSSVLSVPIDHSIILGDSREFEEDQEVSVEDIAETVVTDATEELGDVLNDQIVSTQLTVDETVESVLEDILENLSVREDSPVGTLPDQSTTVERQSSVSSRAIQNGNGVTNGESLLGISRGSIGVGDNSAFGQSSIASIGSSPPNPARASTPNSSTGAEDLRRQRLFRDVADWTICRPCPALPVEPLDADGRYKGARHYVDVRINPEIHVQLIGKNRCTLQKLRDDFDVELDFSQETDDDPWLIRVYGLTYHDVEACKDRLWLYATNICKSRTAMRLAKEKAAKRKPKPKDAPTRIMVKVPLPFAFQEFVIGLRGAEDPLRLAFNDKYNVSITGPREDAVNRDEVSIVGEPPNAERAETAIYNERRIYTKMPKRTFVLEFHVIDRILGRTPEAKAKIVTVNKLKHIQISRQDNETVTVYGSTKSVVEKAEDKFLSHQLRLNEAAAKEIKKNERKAERVLKQAEKQKADELKAKEKAEKKQKSRKRASPEIDDDDEDIVEDSMIEDNRRRQPVRQSTRTHPMPPSPEQILTAYTAVHEEPFVFDGHDSDDDEDQADEPAPSRQAVVKRSPVKKQPRQDVYIRRAKAARLAAVVEDLSDEEITIDFINAPYEEAMATAAQIRDRLNMLKQRGKQVRDQQLALGVQARAPKPKVVVATLIAPLAPVSAVAPSQSMITRENRRWLLALFNKWQGRRYPITTTWSNVDRQMKVVAYKVAAAHVHTHWTADYWELQLKVGKYYMSQRELAMETPEQRAAKYKKQSACRRFRMARLRAQKLGLPPPTKADMEKAEADKKALMGDAYVNPDVEPAVVIADPADVIVPHAEGEHDYTMYESDGGDENEETAHVEEDPPVEENPPVEEDAPVEEEDGMRFPVPEDQFAPEEEPEQEEYADDDQAFNSDDDEENGDGESGSDHNGTDAFNDFYGFA